MWAMMPMFRILSSGVCRGIAFLYSAKARGDEDAHEWAGLAPLSAGGFRPPRCRIPYAGSRSCWSSCLPPVMREGAVRLRHPVRVFLLLYRLALALRRQDQLGGEALGHCLLFAQPAVLNQPAHR